MKIARIATAAFVLTLFHGVAAYAGQVIKEISVFDNSKTKDSTVIYIAGVDKGDSIDTEDLAEIEKRLVSSGLFKSVNVYTTEIVGGVRLIIEAKDKHSWVIAPTYYNQPTNKGGGVGFGENNLFGENKKLLLYGQYATGETFFIGAFIDPSIGGTILSAQVDTFLRSARIFEYSAPQEWLANTKKVRQTRLQYLNSGVKIGLTVFRFATLDLRLRGAHVSYKDTRVADGATIEDITGNPADDPNNVPEPGAEGWDISGETVLKFDRRANWYGIATGNALTLSFERALTVLGSDFDYWYAQASYYHAWKFFDSHNLVLKLNAGYGKDLPFQQEFVSGGTNLRGYKGDQFRGDTRFGLNTEYSLQLVNIKGVALRALVFWDTRYTTYLDDDNDAFRSYLPDYKTKGLAPFRNSVGFGTRLFIRQIVIPLLGLDFGYGLETGATEIYLAIGLTEF